MGKLAHGNVGIDVSSGEWEGPNTHTIGGSSGLNVVRTATYVVAASGAPTHVKAQADIVCGTDYAANYDNLAIQAAIDAAPTSSSVIQLVGNIFDITAPIVMNKNSMTLQGESQYGTVLSLANGVNDNVIEIPEGVLYAVVKHFRISGNKANQTGGNGIRSLGPGLFIERVIIGDCYQDSINLAGTVANPAPFRIRYVHCHTSGRYNLYAGHYCDDSWINNSIFGQSVASNVYLASADIHLINNNIYSAGWNGAAEVGDNPNILVFNSMNYIIGNFINDAAANGIRGSGVDDLTISDNVFWNNSKAWVAGGMAEINIGTGAADSLRVLVTNNHFITTNCDYYVQMIESGGFSISGIISGNTMNGGATWGVSGIDLSGVANPSKVLVKDNVGVVYPSEVRTASGSLTAGNANAIFMAFHMPESQDGWTAKVTIDVTTGGGTVGAHGDVGIADDAAGTNRGTEFFDDLLLNNVQVNDSLVAGDGGTQTKWVFIQDSASATDGWIVGQILDANAGSLVGKYYIEYAGR